MTQQRFERVEEHTEWCTTCKKVATERCLADDNKICRVLEVPSTMMVTTCSRCSRQFHVHEEVVLKFSATERILCLPCSAPERWKWDRNEETGALYETPVRRPVPKNIRIDRVYAPGEEEALLLQEKQLSLISAKTRLPELVDAVNRLSETIAAYRVVIAKAPEEIKALQALISAAMTDPQRGVRHQVAKLKRALLEAQQQEAAEIAALKSPPISYRSKKKGGQR